MEISNIAGNTNQLSLKETNKVTEESAQSTKEKNEGGLKTEPQSDVPVSELITLAAGGIVTHSIDGDTVELSTESQTDFAASTAKAANTETATEAAANTANTANTETTDTGGENSTVKATQMFLQGKSDAKIKEETGISQSELDKIKESYN